MLDLAQTCTLDKDYFGMGRCEVPAGSESKVECEKQSQPEKLSLVGKLCHAIIEINGAKNKKFYED